MVKAQGSVDRLGLGIVLRPEERGVSDSSAIAPHRATRHLRSQSRHHAARESRARDTVSRVDDGAAWIDAFVMAMSRLGTTAPPQALSEMGRGYFLTHRRSDPVKVAKWHVEQFGLPRGES